MGIDKKPRRINQYGSLSTHRDEDEEKNYAMSLLGNREIGLIKIEFNLILPRHK